MRTFGTLSISFASGALGGLANGLVVWFIGAIGLTAICGVSIAPEISAPYLYQRIVWGGIWGCILLVPFMKNHALKRGVILSFAPTLVQLLIVFPLKADKGLLGLELGVMTPIFVIFYNIIWGIVSSYWFKVCNR